MIKKRIKFNELSTEKLSPGDIYWQKSPDEEILISKKAQILNFETILKLSKEDQSLYIVNPIDQNIHQHFIQKFNKTQTDFYFKDKLQRRMEFNYITRDHYYYSEIKQDDLNILSWKLFCELSKKEIFELVNINKQFLTRALNISSSYTFIAFMLGHYDTHFLKMLYTENLRYQIKLFESHNFSNLEGRFQDIQKKTTLSHDDIEFLKQNTDQMNMEQSIIFEKFNGSGPRNINLNEMTDLEVLLISLNYYYKYNTDQSYINILSEINKGIFMIDNKMRNLINRNFELLLDSIHSENLL